MDWIDDFGHVVRSTRVENGFQDLSNGLFYQGSWVDLDE
jgi:hypothetical protein